MPIMMRGFTSLLGYAVVLYGIYKIYTLSNEVSEMKDMLRDIRSTLDERAAAERAAAASHSPENLIRAVNSASYQVPEIEDVRESH